MVLSKRFVGIGWVAVAAMGLALCASSENPPGSTRLNNLVMQLAQVETDATSGETVVAFTNPRSGWIHVAVSYRGTPGESEAELRSDAATIGRLRLSTRTVPQDTREGMAHVPEGRYELRLSRADNAAVGSVTVRAIPELHYCRFPADPILKEYGTYDWGFLEKHVLPHVNTIVGLPTEESDAHIAPWIEQGGKWIAYGSLPHDKGLTADMAFDYWRENSGFSDPRLSGLIADEFQGRQNEWYPAWTEAMRRLGNDPALKGKAFYGYCGGPGMYSRPQTRALVRAVLDAGYYMAWERYLHEVPTLGEAQALLDSHLGQEMAKWRATFPGCEKQLVMVAGLFTHGLGLDVQPEVDYKVWMDMQMQYYATNPLFDGLFGLHWWISSYADEESLRWMGQLFRHYAIEGKSELLSDSFGYQYTPGLIANADFADGLNGWTVDAASPDSARTDYMEYYAQLQGRYWHRAGFPDEPAGNTFLWTRSQADKANVVSQTMRGLNPGELYSVKVLAADYEDISLGASDRKLLPMAVTIDGAETVRDKTFVGSFSGSGGGNTRLPFDGQRPAWFNLHRVVFRATGAEAVLRISDWAKPDEPGGPAGREFMINFVEAQPYFDS